MNEQEIQIQTAIGTLFPLSILVTTGKWYTIYSSDEGTVTGWATSVSSAVKMVRASGSFSPIIIGKLTLNPDHIVMWKLGMPEPETSSKINGTLAENLK